MSERELEKGEVKKKGTLASNLFAVAAVVFAVLAVVLYLRDSRGGGIAPIPTAAAGGNQIVNVTQALKAQGLDVQQPPGHFIPVGALDVPGQGIEVNGQPGFVFLFATAEDARAAAETANPENMLPERVAGTPVPTGERRLTQQSNVILMLIGGDEALWQKVEAAIGSLS